MISVNKATLIGRIGKDPERRSFSNGGFVVSFTMATSESWKDKNTGEWKDITEWHTVQIFNEVKAEFIHKHAHKGDLVMVEGKIKTRKWQDKDGNDRYSTEIVVEKFSGDAQVHKDKDKNSGGSDGFSESRSSNQSNNKSSNQSNSRQNSFSQDLDDDIPF